MEAELDATLGYEKKQKGDMDSADKRNGHSLKKLKSQLGSSRSMSPGIGTASSSRKLSPNIRGTSPGLRRRPSRSTAGG